mmetsp:Transcript_35568/g.85840  ORF Transcript_35568/g.85840 Transcript_35568/m.85840 type:complete len:200 (-) Transcript_35568:179-778(-)
MTHEIIVHRMSLKRSIANRVYDIVVRDCLLLQKELRQCLYLILLLCNELHSLRVGLVYDVACLLVHGLSRRIRVRLLLPWHLVRIPWERQLAHTAVHAVNLDGAVHELGDALQIIGSASGDPPKEHLLRRPPCERHLHDVHDLILRAQEDLLGKVLCVPQRAARTGDDGHLKQRVRVLQEPASDSMTSLVVRHYGLLVV